MKLTDSPDCETCGELETAEHLILHCTKYQNMRAKYTFGHFTKLIDLFKTKNLKMYEEVTDFVKEAALDL